MSIALLIQSDFSPMVNAIYVSNVEKYIHVHTMYILYSILAMTRGIVSFTNNCN
jgi:hypothetical protein